MADAVGMFPMVFILPEDINLTSGSPRYHRNFLDMYLCQFSAGYLADLIEYQRILKQRNALLKMLKDGEKQSGSAELDAWDSGLISVAVKVMRTREKFIREIEPSAGKFVRQITRGKEKVSLKYLPSIEIGEPVDSEHALVFFRQYRTRDKRLGTTLVGPHRDAIEIILDEKPLREFGSLGQKKTVMIAMKLGALEVMTGYLKERPILIVDEAFAEFDNSRTRSLLSLLSQSGQVFLASADEKGIGFLKDDMRIFEVDSGIVTMR